MPPYPDPVQEQSDPEQFGDGDARDTYLVGDPLPKRMSAHDMCRLFNIKLSTFRKYVAAGKVDRFELLPRIGPRAWSGELLGKYLNCEAGSSRFVTTSKK